MGKILLIAPIVVPLILLPFPIVTALISYVIHDGRYSLKRLMKSAMKEYLDSMIEMSMIVIITIYLNLAFILWEV